MANNISGALGDKFLPILDATYQAEAKTFDLTASADSINFIDVNTIKLRKMTMDGLGDVDRNGNLPKGSVNVTTETHVLEIDRGTIFNVDPMDNEETQAIAFGQLGAEFLRTRVIPEIDAYRFSKIAGYAGTTVEANLTASDVKTALDTALNTMDEAEIPEGDRRIYASIEVVSLLEQLEAFDKYINVAEVAGNVGRRATSYKGVPVIKIPRTRFYTAITLNDGSSDFGYIKNALTGKDINFLVVHLPAVRGAVVKYNPMNIIPATMNQTGTQDIMKFRIYHDIFILDNKKVGVYLHHKTT